MTCRMRFAIAKCQVRLDLILALLIMTGLAVGCSGDTADEPSETAPVDSDSASVDGVHRLDVFVGTGKATRHLHVKPATELWSGNSEQVGTTTRSLSPKTETVTLPDGTQTGDLEAGEPEAWFLVRAALLSCGADEVEEAPFIEDQIHTFYFLPNLVNLETGPTCDRLLRAQQTLLCAGDLLAQVSEARSPLVWEIPSGAATASSMPEGPYTIPPTTERNAFIARDLAILTLAHITWLDLIEPASNLGGYPSPRTCTDLYANAYTDPTWALSVRSELFDVESSSGVLLADDLPKPVSAVATTDQAATVADDRLTFKAHVLRAASRLLPDLLTDGVYADLAGAARRRSREGDFARGQAVLWGTREPEGGYNSLAHAIRVVGQRWQVGRFGLEPWDDPTLTDYCGTIAPIDALDEAYGTDKAARVENLPVTTASQQDAISRLESTGIVLAEVGFSTTAERQQMIVDQLLFAGAVEAGMDPTLASVEAYRQTPAGKNIEATFDGVTDEDYRFAEDTIRKRYQVMTQTDGLNMHPELVASANEPEANLHPTHKTFLQSYANVFHGAMPKSDLDNRIMSKVGGLQTAAQCSETGAATYSYGTNDAWDFAMQDGFAIGQSLYSRLVAIREAETRGAMVASKAAAETRAWSGEGRIFVTGSAAAAGDPAANSIEVVTLGFEPSDFGVDTAEDMESQLILVWGQAIHADCAANLTTACPSDMADRLAVFGSADVRAFATDDIPVFDETSGTYVDVSAQEARRYYGSDGTWGRFLYTPGTAFAATFTGSGQGDERVYAVLRRDPASLAGHGKVLGAVSLRKADETTAMIVSSRQAKLYDDILGINRRGLMSMNLVGRRTLAETNAYCLEGVPYDTFVPLENELTSDGDGFESSWRYVLNLAKQASYRADELGDKYLDIGLQKELRREAANEEVGEICGAYGQLDKVEIEDGKPVAGEADGPVASCLGGEKVDVMFLGLAPDSLNGLVDPPKTAELKRLLDCEGTSESQLCSKDALTFGEMGLDDVGNFPDDQPDSCEEIRGAAESLGSGFEESKLMNVSHSDWRDPGRLRGVADTIRMSSWFDADDELHWQVKVGGVSMLMGSHNDTEWPGCQRTLACDYDNNPLYASLATLFNVDTGAVLTAEGAERLRWQVEGALWTLAAMGGVVPADMFSFPTSGCQLRERNAGRSSLTCCDLR